MKSNPPRRNFDKKLKELFGALSSIEAKLFIFVIVVFALTILPLNSPNEKSHFCSGKSDPGRPHIPHKQVFTLCAGRSESVSGKLLQYFFSWSVIFIGRAPRPGAALGPPGGVFSPFGAGMYAAPAEVIAVQLFSAFCTALSAVFVYKLCSTLGSRKYPAIAVSLVYAFATPVWVFGKTQFPHTYSALFLVMAYYFVLKTPRISSRSALIVDILSAVAVSIEYTNAVLLLPEMAFIFGKLRRELDVRSVLERISVFFAPVLVVGFLLLVYNYVLFHNPFTFPEDYWIGYDGQASSLSQFSTPLLTGLQELLLSPSRGLLLFSPVVVLAIPGSLLLAKKRRWEVILLESVFLCNLLLYSKWYLWDGGGSFGPRFLVTSIPLLVIPIFAFI